MALQKAQNFQQRIKYYVPGMTFAADALYGVPNQIDWLVAPLAIATLYTSAALTTGVANTVLPGLTAPEPWGREYSIVASAACTRTFNVRGRDYLNQPMSATGAMNGATLVALSKAFKYIDQIVLGASADVVTISLASTARLGLPYKATALQASLEGGVSVTAGTLVTGAQTNPQTGTSSDPRGLYTTNAALNGAVLPSAVLLYDFNNLHGFAHFWS